MGALLAVLTLAYLMMFKPLAYPDSDRLMKINYQRFNANSVLQTESFIYPAAELLYKSQQANKIMSDMAMLFYTEEVIVSEAMQPKFSTTYITNNWFELLAIPMALGDYPLRLDEAESYVPGAIISYKNWQSYFSGRKDILSQHIVINGISHPIIGITAENFIEPQLYKTGRDTQVWLPWKYNNSDFKEVWNFIDNQIVLVGKLHQDMTSQQAALLLAPEANEAFIKHSDIEGFYKNWNVNFHLVAIKTELSAGSINTVYVLVAGVLGLLLITATNVANLFLARIASQRKNLAISASLGAKKSQLKALVFSEALLLMIASMIFALFIAKLGLGIMQYYFSENLARVNELQLSYITFVSGVVVSFILACIFTQLSVKTIDYFSLNASLQTSGKGTATQVAIKSRVWLICSQISIAMLLVFSSGLLLQDAIRQLKQPLGFNSAQLMSIEFAIATLDWQGWSRYAPKVRELEQKLLLLPQIEDVSFSRTPLDDTLQYPLTDVKSNHKYYSLFRNVDHHYFNVLQQEILQGDGFTELDVKQQTQVLIVNQAFASILSADGNAVLGRKLLFDDKPHTVIGIVANLALPTQRNPPARFYITNFGTATFMMVKLKKNQELSREQMIKTLFEVDKQFALSKFEHMSKSIKVATFEHTLTASIAIFLAFITIFIASIGLYGILSYCIQMRRFELGTRMAIGAKGKDLFKLVLQENIKTICIGIVVSMIAFSLLAIVFSDFISLYLTLQIIPVFLVTLGLISIMSFTACYLPLKPMIKHPVIYALKGND
nr:ABC transporter permease [Pseudoalteromonas denitrificans]